MGKKHQKSSPTNKNQGSHTLKNIIKNGEDFLMQRLHHYAVTQGYSRYTSNLVEAWRLSINGLSTSFLTALSKVKDENLELTPDENYVRDPAAAFGIIEAKRHRQRGVSLEMFLGLLKYYRQAYHDLICSQNDASDNQNKNINLVNRFFDRLEIGFCSEWAASREEHQIELQNTNRLLTNEKNKYLALFESLPHPVILLTPDLKLDNMNYAAANLLGAQTLPGAHYYCATSEQELVKTSVCNTLEKIETKHFTKLMNSIENDITQFVNSQQTKTDLEKEIRLNESDYYLEIRLAKFLDFVGHLRGIIVFIQDLTDKKLVEAEQNRIRSQLVQSDKMACIGQLAAGVAHEINNPIGFVNSNLNRLREYIDELTSLLEGYHHLIDKFPSDFSQLSSIADFKTQIDKLKTAETEADLEFVIEDISELIRESQDGTERIRHIVCDLKDFAHPGDSKPQWVDLNKSLLSTINVVWNEIKYKADLEKNLGELPNIFCMPGKLNQVFMNLIVNASHAIETEGKIVISTENKDGEVVVTISDNGCGIPDEVRKKIFNPFFTTKPVGSGTGLGLHISNQIIQKHKGTIAVESTPGKGTQFTITLPIEPIFDKPSSDSNDPLEYENSCFS
jgi:signal transduction histidine kinase